jgi:hypothetical protein
MKIKFPYDYYPQEYLIKAIRIEADDEGRPCDTVIISKSLEDLEEIAESYCEIGCNIQKLVHPQTGEETEYYEALYGRLKPFIVE